MFPIHSVSGRVIAFSGRTLKADNQAKYVNSPETEIYIKSKNLLGVYFAKSEIAKKDRCILVEGNVDVVMMHQMGISNVVASCGTSLTEEQIRLIKRFTENITIMYDGDSAGLHAAIRAISLILKEGMNPRVVFLPDGDDPDSYSRKHTLEEIQDFIEKHEQDGIAFKTDLLLGEAGDDPLKKANLINEIADTVADIPDAIKRQVYVDTVSRKFGIEADIIQDRVRKTRDKLAKEQGAAAQREEARRQREQAAQAPAPTQEDNTQRRLLEVDIITGPSERELLGFIVRYGRDPLVFESDSEFYNPDGTQTVAEFIDDALAADEIVFTNPAYQAAYEAYFALYDQGIGQDQIVINLLNGEDRAVAAVVADLATEKYEITVHNFSDALTTHDSWLATFVPRAILAYHEKRLTLMQNDLLRRLTDASPEEQTDIMGRLNRLSEMKKTINSKLGREKR